MHSNYYSLYLFQSLFLVLLMEYLFSSREIEQRFLGAKEKVLMEKQQAARAECIDGNNKKNSKNIIASPLHSLQMWLWKT